MPRSSSPSDVFILDLARAAAFAGLPPEARTLLRLCDGTRDVTAVCAASPLPPARTQQVLERLHRLGLVALASQATQATQASQAFTDEEEQFFASSIDHLVDEDSLR